MAEIAQIRRSPCKRANFPSATASFKRMDSVGCASPLPRSISPDRSGCQNLLNALRRGRFVDVLDGSKFPHETIEGRLIDLPLAVGLLGLPDLPLEVPHDLADQPQVAPSD